MNKINLSKITNGIRAALNKHTPEILTITGIVAMASSTVMAVKETPKAIRLLEEKKREDEKDKLPLEDVVKTVWRCYISSVITGGAGIVLLLGANSINRRRNAALAAVYALSETALKRYQTKVVDAIGEKKEEAVRDAVAKDRLECDPVSSKEIIITEKGNVLCYDHISGRYFKSDIDKLKKAAIVINRLLLKEGYVSLNDFYYEIGLSNTKIGYDIGWKIENDYVDLKFSSQLADDGTPCLVLDYSVEPKYDYSK